MPERPSTEREAETEKREGEERERERRESSMPLVFLPSLCETHRALCECTQIAIKSYLLSALFIQVDIKFLSSLLSFELFHRIFSFSINSLILVFSPVT